MSFTKVSYLLTLALIATANVFAASDLPSKFTSISRDMQRKISRLESCQLSQGLSKDLSKWILYYREELADDMGKSRHDWLTGGSGSCANTKAERYAPIYFYYDACENVSGTDNIARTIVAQSVHHLGPVSSKFANDVASAIVDASSSCDEPAYEFGDTYCGGNQLTAKEAIKLLPLPHQTTRTFGGVVTRTRQRLCYAVDGCTDWKSSDLSSDKIMTSPIEKGTGKFTLSLNSDTPYLTLDLPRGQGYSHLSSVAYSGQQGISTYAYCSNCNPLYLSYKLTNGSGYTTPHLIFNHLEFTNSCIRMKSDGKFSAKDASGNSITHEVQTVVYTRY